MDVEKFAKWDRLLSVIEEDSILSGYRKDHPIGQMEEIGVFLPWLMGFILEDGNLLLR